MDTGNGLKTIVYGNDTFVALTNDGILTSSDGITWSNRAISHFIYSIAFGKNLFVGTGSRSIFTSSDGITWTERDEINNRSLEGITYGNDMFVAVGSGGRILTSKDATAWTKQAIKTDGFFNAITYGNNTFVAVGYDGLIASSKDGIAWTLQTSGIKKEKLDGIICGNNVFVAVGDYGNVFLISTDGVNWTEQNIYIDNLNFHISAIAYGNNMFVAVGYAVGYEGIITSSDGINWTKQCAIKRYLNLNYIEYEKNMFIASSYDGIIFTSPDGINWTNQNSKTSNNLDKIRYVNNMFMAIGWDYDSSANVIVSSSNGIDWTEYFLKNKYSDHLNDVTYGNNMFVAISRFGGIFTSSDRINWTKQDLGMSTEAICNRVIYKNNTFIVVGNNGTILISKDGINWTDQKTESISDVGINDIDYGNNMYVAVGGAGDYYDSVSVVLTSTDGSVWNKQVLATQDFSHLHILNKIIFGNNIFVAASGVFPSAELYSLYTSSDGVNWTKQKWHPEGTWDNSLVDITYGDSTFVAVGNLGAIFTSKDGMKWTAKMKQLPNGMNGIAYGNNTFIVVGNDGKILQSDPMDSKDSIISIFPQSKFFTANSGKGDIVIDANVDWTAVSNSSWITITSMYKKEANYVSYSIAANPTSKKRTGMIIIGDKKFVINQDAEQDSDGNKICIISAFTHNPKNLMNVRDILLQNPIANKVVDLYYIISPKIMRFISE